MARLVLLPFCYNTWLKVQTPTMKSSCGHTKNRKQFSCDCLNWHFVHHTVTVTGWGVVTECDSIDQHNAQCWESHRLICQMDSQPHFFHFYTWINFFPQLFFCVKRVLHIINWSNQFFISEPNSSHDNCTYVQHKVSDITPTTARCSRLQLADYLQQQMKLATSDDTRSDPDG